jgi:hypothetical protein
MIDFFGFDFVGILILLCILIYLLFDLTLKTQISKLVEGLVEWPASSLYRGPRR